MTSNPSVTWGRLVVDALVANGVEHVVIAPGSRSTPLVIAAHEHEAITTYSVIDERSAAYFALGRSKRTGEPTALVCTSGTAGANMYPAVIEADRSRTPIIVCTADRPGELQVVEANQTIDQRALFGNAVRSAPVIPPATPNQKSVDAVYAAVASAVGDCLSPNPGPVHLNIPFRKPLSPAEPIADWNPPDPRHPPPKIAPHRHERSPSRETIETTRTALRHASRPVIVAGPLPVGQAECVTSLAAKFGIPVFADPLSGARFGPPASAEVLGGYDGFLDPGIVSEWPTPDLILRFGARPTSVRLQRYLAKHTGEQVHIDPVGAYRDPTISTTMVVSADPTRFVESLLASGVELAPEPGWTDRFLESERRYWSFVERNVSSLPPEGRIAHEIFTAIRDNTTVFVSNSMPIRDVDRFAAPSEQAVCVLANRGASGIDGITSSALGAASGTDDHVVLLTGDLALYHDMNGLLAIDRCDVHATIVVVNNHGGGIFHKLPIADVDPPFSDHFLTPHGLEFDRVAALYDLPYRTMSPADISSNMLNEIESSIISVDVDGSENHRRREAFAASVRAHFSNS